MKTKGLLAIAALGWLTVPAVAGATDYDTSAAMIECNTVIGTITAKPLLTLSEQPDTVLKIKATIGGCTVTGATPADPPLQVLSGKLQATLAVTGDASCVTLVSGFQETGDFVFTWKTAAGQKLDSAETAFTVDSGGLVAGLLPIVNGTYGVFTATGTVSSGSAFGGAAPPGLLLVSGEDVFNMLGQCCTDAMSCTPVGKGIKKLHFGIGQVRM